MGREFWGCDDAGATHRNRQVSAKARETLGDPPAARVANQGADGSSRDDATRAIGLEVRGRCEVRSANTEIASKRAVG